MPASMLEPPAVAPAVTPTPIAAGPIADPAVEPAPAPAAAVKPKDILIIDYSGDLEKVWATMILASTSAAMGVKTRVFVTFWGLPVFVKDDRRVTGQTWMQKMLAVMERPGISHRKLSRLDFFGMGPWMMRSLAKRYGVASPKELLEAAQALGVEFIPCQMTMEMFGLTPDDMIEGMAEPVGAATVIGLMTEDSVPLFI
jgi:peroxiredoxin family protein